MKDTIVLLSTCETVAEGERIARALVEDRLAACVNVVPGITSVYRWKDAVESATEVLLVIKTSAALMDELRSRLEALHSYELPECLALAVAGGSPAYLGWLESGLKQSGSGPR